MTGTILALLLTGVAAPGVTVSGRVLMPETCSPEVSPAVVRLEAVGSARSVKAAGDPLEVHSIDQQGMRFEPRITALPAGSTVRFGNSDPDLHNVHIGNEFNRAVAPGGTADFTPTKPGIYRVLCDIHAHMRAYLVVSGSAWVTTCGRTGAFLFENVPPGRYQLRVWHEMGEPQEREVDVSARPVVLNDIVVKEGVNPTTIGAGETVCATGCEPWPLVIDRIAVTLAASLDAAGRSEAAERAVPLAQDAFYRDFEASGMDAAIRVHLGQDRAARLEGLLQDVTDTTRAVVAGSAHSPAVLAPTRRALLDLARASSELNRKGVTERSRIFATTSPAFWVPKSARPPENSDRSRVVLPLLVTVGFMILATLCGMTARQLGYAKPQLKPLLIFVNLMLACAGIQLTWRELQQTPPVASPASGVAQGKPSSQPAGPPSATGAAPVRERPIGVDVTRNHLRIAASWYPAVRVIGGAAPGPDDIDLVAHIHATEGNPNGFAKGEWLPYLSIKYTLTSDKGVPVTGTFRPLLAAEGPRYVTQLKSPGTAKVRLTLHLTPPAPDLVGRLDDPASGVAPWWEPFDATFEGAFQLGK